MYGFSEPDGIAFDGTHLWVTNLVQKGTSGLFHFSAPTGLAYDGSQVWVTNVTGNSVSDIVDR